MATNKKYDFTIEESKSLWTAKITRKITSKKITVTKQKDGFKTSEEATKWAEEALIELSNTLKKSNERHGAQRKNLEDIRRKRSNRRAEKTELAKAKKAEEEVQKNEELGTDIESDE